MTIGEIDEKAKKYMKERSEFFKYRDVDEGDLQDAFFDGAQWMQLKMIDGVIRWCKLHKEEIGISRFDNFMKGLIEVMEE